MATQTSKKTGSQTKRKTSGKKTTSKSKKNNHPSKDTSLTMVQYEIAVVLILALTVFVMISIYFKSGGIVGDFVRRLLFGVFGITAWILPVGIFGATFLKVFNRGNERLNIRILLALLTLAFISVLAHVMYVDFKQIDIALSERSAFFAALANYYSVSAGYQVGGGFIGALVGDLLLLFVGRLGAYVVLAVIFISLFIVVTEQSFIMLVQKAFNGVVQGLKNLMNYIGIKSEQRQLAKEEARLIEAKKKAEEEREAANIKPISDQPSKAVEMTKEEKKEAKRKEGLIASLLKSTIYKEEDGYDFVKQIEEKEAQEKRLKEAIAKQEADKLKESESGESTHGGAIEMAASTQETVGSGQEENKGSVFEQESATAADFSKMDTKPLTKKDEELMASFADEPVIGKGEKLSKSDVEKGKKVIEQEILKEVEQVEKVYHKPPIELLKENVHAKKDKQSGFLDENRIKLEETLASFGVGATVVNATMGPSVTRYELQPNPGVKVSKIVNLADDIALNLAANGIRIEAPIPGKSAVGIEVPNIETSSVLLREVLDTPEFNDFPSNVAFGLGKDISGKAIVTDIGRMPHLLIAGATGSGKSVCVNTLITSILYKSSPEDVKLLMIDPKVVELSIYNGIPHLLIPVVTDPKKAASALNWAVQEMLERYKLFAEASVRDIKGYNKAIKDNEDGLKKLPQIVIIVDELADLMVAAAGEVEEAICRLAQMARAAGLHLIIATQRPSVDVITGLIKANIPSRIAFNVSSGTDSRTIIDMNGAEKLLGKGDMLFFPVGLQKPVRVQGAFVSDKEIENIVTYLKDRKKEEYDEKIMMQLDRSVNEKNAPSEDYDPLFEDALALCVEKQKASASMIQRKFRVGYNRAARILDQLFDAGYVGDEEGSKPRKMLLTKTEFEQLKARANGEDMAEGPIDEVVNESKKPVTNDTVTNDVVINDTDTGTDAANGQVSMSAGYQDGSSAVSDGHVSHEEQDAIDALGIDALLNGGDDGSGVTKKNYSVEP